jgi:hypothetical protein
MKKLKGAQMNHNLSKFSSIFLLIFLLINFYLAKASQEEEGNLANFSSAYREDKSTHKIKCKSATGYYFPSIPYLLEITHNQKYLSSLLVSYKCLEVQQFIHTTRQAEREKLAYLIDFKILTQFLKSKIIKLDEDNKIKAGILTVGTPSKLDLPAQPSSYLESIWSYWFGSRNNLNQEEIESTLEDNLKVSLIKRTTLHRTSFDKQAHFPTLSTQFLPKEIMDKVMEELRFIVLKQEKNSKVLLHRYNFADDLFVDNKLDNELDLLIKSYQGSTKEQESQSLLTQYQTILAQSFKLDSSLEENQLTHHFNDLDTASLKAAPTEISLENTEEELDILKGLNLFELHSLSLKGPILSIALVEHFKENFSKRMKNLVALSLDFESFEPYALEQLLASLINPLITLALGSNLNSETLIELKKPLEKITLRHLTLQSKEQYQGYITALRGVLLKAPNLKSLNVQDNPNISQKISNFGLGLTNCSKIKNLNLRNTGLNSINLQEFIFSILPNLVTSLKTIDIRDNPNVFSFDVLTVQEQYPRIQILFSKQEEQFLHIAQVNDSLCFKSIKENAEGLETSDLANRLKSTDLPKVKSLIITGKVLNPELGYLVYLPLSKMDNLSSLSLIFKRFEPAVLERLLNGLSNPIKTLKVGPNLMHTHFNEIQSYKYIDQLEEFILPAYRQHKQYVINLTEMLSQMTRLDILNLQDNYNLTYDLKLLASSLQCMTNLRKLNFKDTALEWQHLKPFINSMSGCSNDIIEIDLSNNSLDLTPSHPNLNERLKLLHKVFSNAGILLNNGKKPDLFDQQDSDKKGETKTHQEGLILETPIPPNC